MIDDLNMQIANAPTQQMVDDLTTMRDNYKQQAADLQDDLDTANGMDFGFGRTTSNAANDRLSAEIERG